MLSRRKFALLATAACVPCHGAGAGAPRSERAGDHPSFSVMLWTLNGRGSFEQNLEHVAQAGYRHVELVDEYQHWNGGDWARNLSKMRALQLSVDAMAGVKAAFADPTGAEAFLAGVKQVIPSAHRLGCRQLILLSGNHIEGVAPERQHAASVEALRRAAGLLADAGLTAVIEPIDRLENPSIALDGVTEAFEIVETVGSPHIKVLYDLYHEQRGRGNLIEKLEKHIDQVGLIHVADVPGRHEPGSGEVNYPNVYRTLVKLRYRGVIAMEFYPSGEPTEALRKAREDALHSMDVSAR